MFREPINQVKYPVMVNWPLLMWTGCYECKRQYRRQKGWTFETGPYHGGRGVYRNICGDCAPTKQVAEIIASRIGGQ